MGLFGFNKKDDAGCCGGSCSCNCSGGCGGGDIEEGLSPVRGIKVLGSGCKKCNDLEVATKEALVDMGIDEEIGHVTDFADIAAYGVMTTPALVIDGNVVSYGKVLKKGQVIDLIKKTRG
ncbi:MAG: thioredoxin family protein [Anaerovoracaceae bacterium]